LVRANRAASGQAAAPPSSVPNSRLLIRSPRRRGRFDHLVGAGEKRWRDGQAKRFRRLNIDH
jgi:hypothetical protein